MENEVTEDNAANERDTYLFLDFNGKIPLEVFESKAFVQIANLQEKNPLVQVNDIVFKGTYEYSTGTNLFFEETEEAPPPNAFEQQAPIHLKYSTSEMKVLNLKPVKISTKKDTLPNEVTKIEYNFNWEYKELLDRFEKGTLRIEDIATKEYQVYQDVDIPAKEYQDGTIQDPIEENLKETKDKERVDIHSENMDVMLEISNEFNESMKDEENSMTSAGSKEVLESDYGKLKVLAMRPVKRAVSPELVAECEEKYQKSFEYHNIERQILMPCDAFRTETAIDINELSLCDCVDIERCILYGVIPHSMQFPRILTEKEKAALLTFENFDNLSLAARCYVLKNHVDNLENFVNTAPKETLQEKDEFGRTPLQTLEIYKKLCKAVMNRIQEIKHSQNCDDITNKLEIDKI